jgi:HEPN domain-containing protein
MPECDKVLLVVSEWVAKAENDITNATHTLKLGKDCPTDTVCFHAQQGVEKYLKALLVLERIDFPKTHDIE